MSQVTLSGPVATYEQRIRELGLTRPAAKRLIEELGLTEQTFLVPRHLVALRQQLRDLGISQTTIARRARVHRSFVSHVLRGRRRSARVEAAVKALVEARTRTAARRAARDEMPDATTTAQAAAGPARP